MRIEKKFVIPGGSVPVYSEPIPMAGGNAIAVDLTAYTGSGIRVEYQLGNDLQNWSDDTLIIGTVGVGYHFEATTAVITSAFVRLRHTASTTSVVAVGVETASL